MAAMQAWLEWAERRWRSLPEGHRQRVMAEAEREFKALLAAEEVGEVVVPGASRKAREGLPLRIYQKNGKPYRPGEKHEKPRRCEVREGMRGL